MTKSKYHLTKKGLERARIKLKDLEVLKLDMIKNLKPRALDYREVDADTLSHQEEIEQIDRKIYRLKKILEDYELIQAPEKDKRDRVFLGATVVIEMGGSIEEFMIVGTFESDPADQKISDASPLGKSLIGKKEGEEFSVETPMITHSCRLIKIKYDGF